MEPHRRSQCAISCALELAGDKWTLLVIRDLSRGKNRFNDLLDSPEGIATNILSDRLQKLADLDFVLRAKDPADARRNIYSLTNRGSSLAELTKMIASWGLEHIPETILLDGIDLN